MQNIKKTIIKTLHGEEELLKYEIESFVKNRASQNIKNYYCIITAVYNAQDYLEHYFKSITGQSLDFEKYIQIILIDDASTDNSVNIIKAWKKRFSQNISYITNEINGGQSKQRNLALQYAKSPWITFIDADDTISHSYFEDVNNFVKNNDDIGIVSCNQTFYMQQSAKEKKHYLSYRFKQKQSIVNPTHMQGFIQSTASSVFFKYELLSRHKHYFNENIKPIFEDGHFVNTLFIREPYTNIAFLQKPVYYYTKREDKSSTMDSSWLKSGRYNEALRFALLDLLKNDNSLYIQRYVLYQVHWYYKKIIYHPHTVDFLSQEQLDTFQELLKEIFSYIDSNNIETCGVGGMWHKYRIGFYKLYKNNTLFKQVCYIDSYDYERQELKLHYYFHSKDKEVFLLNNHELTSTKHEIIEHKFLDDIFVYEKVIYLQLAGKWEYLDVQLCDVETQISFNKKRYKNGIQLSQFI